MSIKNRQIQMKQHTHTQMKAITNSKQYASNQINLNKKETTFFLILDESKKQKQGPIQQPTVP